MDTQTTWTPPAVTEYDRAMALRSVITTAAAAATERKSFIGGDAPLIVDPDVGAAFLAAVTGPDCIRPQYRNVYGRRCWTWRDFPACFIRTPAGVYEVNVWDGGMSRIRD